MYFLQGKNNFRVFIFYLFLFSFFITIFARSFLVFSFVPFLFLTFLSALSILLCIFWQKDFKIIFLYFLVSFAIFLAIFRFDLFESSNKAHYDDFLEKNIEKEFFIDDEVEVRAYRKKMILKFTESEDRVLMWESLYPRRFYGDKLLVSGYLMPIKNFSSKDEELKGREFDYVNYLKKEGVFYELIPSDVKGLAGNGGNFIKAKLFEMKRGFLLQMDKIFSPVESALLGGLLVGAKEDMGAEILDDFRKTGVIHMVVLSGYNLSLVADFFMKIFAIFGVIFSAMLGTLSILLFTIMTGASSTVVRSALMAAILIFARVTGRNSEAVRVLFVAAFLMLLFNPMLLVFDPSFQLSFVATFGLLVFSPFLESKLFFVPKKILDFRGIISATLSTGIFVAPLLLYMMGEISIVSPLVNVLILIFIPFIMFFGFVATLVSFVSVFLAMIFSYVVDLLLTYDLMVVDFFADFKYAVFENSVFGFWDMCLMYFLYLLLYLLFLYKKRL